MVPNLLLARNDMPDNVACALTTLVFDKTDALDPVHPAAKDIRLRTPRTDPIPIHPGSQRALDDLKE